jgi:hypothetical protein
MTLSPGTANHLRFLELNKTKTSATLKTPQHIQKKPVFLVMAPTGIIL